MRTLHLPFGNGVGTIEVPHSADISPRLLPGGVDEGMLREALKDIKPQDLEDCIYEAHSLGGWMPQTVVRNANYPTVRVMYAVHSGHKANYPGMSPFLRITGRWPMTNTLFLDIRDGRLVRVMPGIEYLALPWMRSLPRDERSASVDFWRAHSFVQTSRNVVDGTLTAELPRWMNAHG